MGDTGEAAEVDLAERINESDGWVRAMGLDFTVANADEVRCEFTVAEHHLQGYGIVHGGVHCGVIESIASVGAAAAALPRGQAVVGLENSTSFIRAVRTGARLHAVATPVTRGRRTQVWEGRVFDDQERLVAVGRVRLLALDPAGDLGGGRAEFPAG